MGRDKISFPSMEGEPDLSVEPTKADLPAEGKDEQEPAPAPKKEAPKKQNFIDLGDDGLDEDDDAGDDYDDEDDGEYQPANKWEEQAMARGWTSQEEWEDAGHDPDDWVDAKSFVKNGELMDVISKQSKKIKKMEKTFNEFQGYTDKIREKARAEAKAELMRERQEALDIQDFEAAAAADDKLNDLNKEAAAVVEDDDDNVEVNEIKDYFESTWGPKNPWYKSNRAMRVTADDLGSEYISKNPNADAEQVFKYVDTQIRKEFPQHFSRKRGKNSVEPGNNSGGRKKAGNSKQAMVRERMNGLTDVERSVGRRFVEQGLFDNLEDYAADLVKNGL